MYNVLTSWNIAIKELSSVNFGHTLFLQDIFFLMFVILSEL